MLPEKSLIWGRSKSCIREIAAYGTARKAEIGAENVFDFSLGNPSVPAPPQVNETLIALLQTRESTELHGYTPAAGLPSLRAAIAEDLRKRLDVPVSADGIYVCCGAAAGLAACCRGLLLPGEEALTFAPFFPEYRVFVEGAGGILGVVPPAAGLQPDLDKLEESIGENTKLLLVNTPNNPSGVVLSAETMRRMGEILREAERRYGHTIYLVSDEPYRELVYDGPLPPNVLNFYDDAIICYSFSKSLSLPGERIGYLAVSERMAEKAEVFAALAGASRASGFVNPPSLMQRCIEQCLGLTSDLSVYKANRDLLYRGLTEAGFDCVYPEGAFYLFMKSPEQDAKVFAERARTYELLLVPSDDFGLEGYVRLAYCVSPDMIRRSLPAFRALAESYGL